MNWNNNTINVGYGNVPGLVQRPLPGTMTRPGTVTGPAAPLGHWQARPGRPGSDCDWPSHSGWPGASESRG